MKRNFPLVLLCVIVSMAVIAAGNLYWKKKKGEFFRRLYHRQSFTLLDGDGKIFKTHELPDGKKVLFIFTPDNIPVSAVKPFRVLAKSLDNEAHLTVAVVSRVHTDIVRNFLRAANFHGRLLTDPANELARYLGARDSLDPVEDWILVVSDRDLKLHATIGGKEVPTVQELKKKL